MCLRRHTDHRMYICVSHVISKIDASRPIDDRATARGYGCAYQCAGDTNRASKSNCYTYCSVKRICSSSGYLQCFGYANSDSAESCAYCTTNSRSNYRSYPHCDAKTYADTKAKANADTKAYCNISSDGHSNTSALQVFAVLLFGIGASGIDRSIGS